MSGDELKQYLRSEAKRMAVLNRRVGVGSIAQVTLNAQLLLLYRLLSEMEMPLCPRCRKAPIQARGQVACVDCRDN